MTLPRLLTASAVVLGAGALMYGAFRPGETPPTREATREGLTPTDRSSGDEPSDRPLVIESPAPAPDGMVWVPGGSFMMGTDERPADAGPHGKTPYSPAHEVEVDGFWLDATEVTNAEFLRFVEATGYR